MVGPARGGMPQWWDTGCRPLRTRTAHVPSRSPTDGPTEAMGRPVPPRKPLSSDLLTVLLGLRRWRAPAEELRREGSRPLRGKRCRATAVCYKDDTTTLRRMIPGREK